MDPTQKKVPKKRGRKPKTTITAKNYSDKNMTISENLIINIKKQIQGEDSDEECFMGYTKEESTVPQQGTSWCWNCCHDIPSYVTIGIPLKYQDKVFHLHGHFCSFECSARYLIDTYYNKNLWEKFSLLNIYYNQFYKTEGKVVPIAPEKYALKKFGGPLDIDDYRENITEIYDILIPPIIPVSHVYHTHESKLKINDSNTSLKLYRKNNTKNKNNIFSTMNIHKN